MHPSKGAQKNMLKAWNFTKNEICYRYFDNNLQKLFRTNPANISCFQDVFSVKLFVFQDVLKTSWRCPQDIFAIRLPKTSSRRLARRLQHVFKTCLQDVLQLCLQDVLEDKKMLHWRRLEEVFSTSSPRRMFAGKFLKNSNRQILLIVF